MNEEIIVICPELSEGTGGVADYTLRVVGEWSGARPVRFLVPDDGFAATKDHLEKIERRGSALRKALSKSDGRVLLQYSAYGFDRHGYPRWLLRELTDWKQKAGGRLVIMFHEIWTFWPVLNKNYLVQELHRRDIAKLISEADVVFTSTASQAEHLRALVPRPVEVLPVGSNIRVTSQEGARRAGMAVLFGLQGSRIKALRQMQTDLKALAGATKITKLVSAGGGNSSGGEDEERGLISSLALSGGFEQRGELSENKVSRLLTEASFGISAQDELSLTKSGTFMAYAAHGLNILSSYGGAKPEPFCWLTQPTELLRGVAAEELKARRENLREWQERTASWPRIAEHLAQALQM